MFYTVSSIDGIYANIHEATRAWMDAGCPRQDGNSVWVTEHDGAETIQTITLIPIGGSRSAWCHELGYLD